jgi:hypothetical protein
MKRIFTAILLSYLCAGMAFAGGYRAGAGARRPVANYPLNVSGTVHPDNLALATVCWNFEAAVEGIYFANDSADFSVQCGEIPFVFEAGDATIAGKRHSGSPLLAQEIRPARFEDCVDLEEPGGCVSKAVQVKKKTTQDCPACIEDCVSVLIATDDEAMVEHNRKIAPCTGGMIQSDGYYICLTDRPTLSDEQKPADIPVSERKQKVLRCNHFDPKTSTWSPAVRTELATTPLDGAIMIDASFNHFEGPLLKKMQEICCEMCPDNCWVHQGNWGKCPVCKCDDSCWKHCLVQEP